MRKRVLAVRAGVCGYSVAQVTALDHMATYLAALHTHGRGLVEITALKTGAKPRKRWFVSSDTSSAVAYALALNDRGYSVFSNVNPRLRERGRIEDTAGIVALPLDFDYAKIDPTGALDLLTRDGLAPSLVVLSGHGLHAYLFLVNMALVADARPVAARLCKFLGSDRVYNANRIMRLPGSINWKPPPVWCLLGGGSGQRYALTDVDRWLDLHDAPSATLPSDRAEVLLPLDPPHGWDELRRRLGARACDAIDWGEPNSSGQPSRSETDWMAVCALVRAGATDEQIRWVYRTQPIGLLKYREAGDHYLDQTIMAARRACVGGDARGVSS